MSLSERTLVRDATLAYVQHVRWALDLVAGAARPDTDSPSPVAPSCAPALPSCGADVEPPRGGARAGYDHLWLDEGENGA